MHALPILDVNSFCPFDELMHNEFSVIKAAQESDNHASFVSAFSGSEDIVEISRPVIGNYRSEQGLEFRFLG